MKPLYTNITNPQDEALRKLSIYYDMPMSHLIRSALQQYIESELKKIQSAGIAHGEVSKD